MATIEEQASQIKKLKEQFDEVNKNLQTKEDRILDLQFELQLKAEGRNTSICSISEKMDDGDEKQVTFYIKQLEEKDVEIEKLKEKLARRNCDLQGLVNNELWEKNREIEKLQKRHASKIIENKDLEIGALKKELAMKETQLAKIKDKISEFGVDISLPSAEIGDQINASLNNANNELTKSCCEHLKVELLKSEKMRNESNEICSILNARLEELAVFLDSLLKHKSVLGFLGMKENRKLRQIVDESLDISRSFTVSLLINPEHSLTQLTNITSLLNTTECDSQLECSKPGSSSFILSPTGATLTYQSHLYHKDPTDENNKSHIIEALRQQIVNLKYELQLRDVEINKLNGDSNFEKDPKSYGIEDVASNRNNLNTTSTTLKYQSDNNIQSESESWSEPDRSVSKARIGLLEESLKSPSKITRRNWSASSESTTEDDCVVNQNLSRTPSKRNIMNESRHTIIELHRQVCDLGNKLAERENELVQVGKSYEETANLLKEEQLFNLKLKHQLENMELKLLDTEAKLIDMEKEKIEVDRNIQCLNQAVESLEREEQKLKEHMAMKDREIQDKMCEIEIEKNNSEILEGELECSRAKLVDLQKEKDELKVSIREEFEVYTKNKLDIAQNDYRKKIEEIQNKALDDLRNLEETINELKADYSVNYVRKAEVDQQLIMIQTKLQDIENLKRSLLESENEIEKMKNQEFRLRKELSESQEKFDATKKQLDNANLKYSQVVGECTKLSGEKVILQQELNMINSKEMELRNQLKEIEKEHNNFIVNYNKQSDAIQIEKSKLEVKISELESANAQLRSKLIMSQVDVGDRARLASTSVCSSSRPESKSKNRSIGDFYSYRTHNNSENSDCASEDHSASDQIYVQNHSSSIIAVVDFERNEATSSPDLGIESDQGRFSSLETHSNVSRPLLQTLELTESMGNLLNVENSQVQNHYCAEEHCCKKTLEMAHENSDLKRKLLRTRRALEETLTQLSLANQRKKQVEKTICKQIHKTSQVLRKAKANLDSGSESDMYKK